MKKSPSRVGLALVVTTAVPCAPALAGPPAVGEPQAGTRPVITRIADIDVNLGMTRRVTAPATGATSYTWRIWTAKKGWTVLARGGKAYRSINFTGEAVRHMGLVQVTARNASGATTSNLSRLRVWGINESYPAAIGSWTQSSGWRVRVTSVSYDAADGGRAVGTLDVRRVASTAGRPAMSLWPGYWTKSSFLFGVMARCGQSPSEIKLAPGAMTSLPMCMAYLDMPDPLPTKADYSGGKTYINFAPDKMTAGPTAVYRGIR
ncbi:hypothetical protein AAEX63_03205 [Luteococcus sp. H138]|uniref:hypothetical protein n=1 Tax=unclassified Luteococcus TaxID=2639923 RepID=UPI00313DBDAA